VVSGVTMRDVPGAALPLRSLDSSFTRCSLAARIRLTKALDRKTGEPRMTDR
jgi:hypothetical protein